MRKTIIRITAIILALAIILTCGAALLSGPARSFAQGDSGDTEAAGDANDPASPDAAGQPAAPSEKKAKASLLTARRAFAPAPHAEKDAAQVRAASRTDEPTAGDGAASGGAETKPVRAPEADHEPDQPAATAAAGGTPDGQAAASDTPAPADSNADLSVSASETAAPAAPDAEASGNSAAEEDRYASLELSDSDLELLARLVYLESRGEPYDGQVAVAEVVLNRVLSDRFPDTVEEVIYQTGQFTPASYIENTTPGEEQYEAVDDAVDGASCVTGPDVVFFSGAPYNDQVYAVIGNHYFCEL